MATAAASTASRSSLSKNLLQQAVGKRRQPQSQSQSSPRPAMAPSLSRLLVSPGKVATAFEWKCSASSSRGGAATILTMNLTRDAMELLVSSHPMFEEPVQSLPSIPLKTEIVRRPPNKCTQHEQDDGESSSSEPSSLHHRSSTTCRRLIPSVAMEFKQILQDWQVSGIVVNWPVQPEGWCGYGCGKVLFVLDHLNSFRCFEPNQHPMCLWDQVHHDAPYEDEWGRSSQYSIVSSHAVHYASKEQYDVNSPGTFTASGVWDDYCRAHWPELYAYHHPATTGTSTIGRPLSHPNKSLPWLSPPTTTLRSNKNWRGS